MIIALLLACAPSSDDSAPYEWVKTWSDEFNGDGALDSDKWTYDIGGDGWGNEQLEYNTDRLDNVKQEDGWMVITAQREDYEGNEWTSARVKTQGLFSQQNGRFVARIQLPPGQGMWPAFWMLGDDIDEVSWPECGEIDIMEARGADPYTHNAALHGPGGSGGDATYDSITVEDNLQDEAHVYAVEWDDDHIAWFLDGELVMTAHPGTTSARWVWDHPFFLILNVAVGGTYVGNPDDTTPDTSRMYVDYVRVFERQM